MKKILVPVLKLSVAAALIYWLVHTKKITAEPFVLLWSMPWLTLFVFGVTLVLILVNNYRWQLLLQGQQIQSTAKQTIPLTFIGLFFNLAMPGAVGGDAIKAYYIAQDRPDAKVRAATSVLMDRVVGLYAMAIIALAAVLTHLDRIMASPNLRALALFVVLLSLGFTVFFIFGFSENVRSHKWTVTLLEKLPGGRIIEKIYDTVHDYRRGKKQFLLGIVLSVLVQSMNIVCLYIIAVNLHYENVSIGALLFIVPLGLIAMAVPISPGGLGVGQVVFLTLFTMYGGLSENLGPTLITIFQVVQAVLGLLGAPFYFMRKAPDAKMAVAK